HLYLNGHDIIEFFQNMNKNSLDAIYNESSPKRHNGHSELLFCSYVYPRRESNPHFKNRNLACDPLHYEGMCRLTTFLLYKISGRNTSCYLGIVIFDLH